METARPDTLSGSDRAVLAVLVNNAGRVVGRSSIRREAGLQHCTPRRCDSSIVSLRRMLGIDAIVTVRGRGWLLSCGSVRDAVELLETSSIAEHP